VSKHHFTSRTKARKRAADVVFEADQRGMGRDPRVLSDLLRERKVITAALTPLPEYSVRIVEGVAGNLRRIDGLITAHAKVPGLDRIPAVDLAVLRVAVWEMLENSEDVPPLVAIDEAISIVKSISTDASPGFVNAVLDAVRRELQAPAWRRERVTEDGIPGETREEPGADADAAVAPAVVGAPSVSDAVPESSEVPTEVAGGPTGPFDGTSDAADADADATVRHATVDDPTVDDEAAHEAAAHEAAAHEAAAHDEEPAPGSGEPDAPADDGSSLETSGPPAVGPAVDGPAPIVASDGSRSDGTTEVPADLPDTGGVRDTEDDKASLRTLRDGHPTLDDLTQADLEELDELLDEY